MDCKRLISVLALSFAVPAAMANPDGAQVVHGNASFTRPDANTLNITNSRNAIINWQRFNIDGGQTTRFIQPDRNSAVLNRVLSNNPSKIHGNLRSNGQVFLINQHGLMVGSGATIDTAGFFGSTLNLTDEDFLNGNLNFSGGGLGGIDNQGYIHAGPDGNVVLIAPDITNGGVIEVDGGNVILAAGQSIRISSLNDGSIEFDVQAPDNTILNLGTIIAKQGAARLFAGNLKHTGAINATGLVRNADGTISLVASHDIEVTAGATLTADSADGGDIRVLSEQGTTRISGSVNARGGAGHGGRIRLLGEQVGVFDNARIDASGSTGGGEILVGGDYQGQNPAVQTARATFIGPQAELQADATDHGDGGKVIVWSDEATRSYGGITARGGPRGGDGGFIETSGGYLDLGDSVPDASAPAGKGGEWLIDPNDILIQVGGGSNVSAGPNFTSIGQPSILDVTLVDAALDNGAVTVSTGTAAPNNQPGDITIQADISYANSSANSLTFNAHNDIFLNANINTSSGPLSVFFNADSDTSGAGQVVLNGDLSLGGGTVDFTSGQAVGLSGGTYSNLTFSNSGALAQTVTGTVTLAQVTLDASTTLAVPAFTTVNVTGGLTLDGAISLDGNFATLTFVGTQTLGGVGEVRFNNAGSDLVTIQPSANGDELTIGAGIAITGNGVGGGTIGNVSAGRTVVNNGTILSNAAGRTITLARFTNNAGATIGGSGGGDLSFTDGWTNSGAITIDGGTLNTGDATTDTWSNPAGAVLSPDGFFTSNGATLELGGTFSAANFLSLGNDGTTTHRIVNAGILDLGQGDLTLPAGETLVIGSGGELSGPGNLISGVGATLALDGSITGNLSNGVTLDASTTLAVPAFTTVNVTGGLTLDGAISLDGNFATLTFVGTQTLGGVGEVRFNNAGSDLVTIQPSANGDELTIGAGIAITGNGVGGGTIGNVSAGRTVVNNGTILSNAAGRTITLARFTNNAGATIGGSGGGDLSFTDGWTNSGAITIDGGTLNTGDATTDTWSNPAGAVLSPDGFFTSNGATLELGGTFSAANFLSLGNDGTTTHRIVNAGILDLGQGDLTLPAGETLVIGSGGELSGPGNLISGVGATLALDGSITGNLSNGVTLDASTTLAVPAFTTVNVTGGLTLDGAISLDGNFATLTFVGTQTLGGVGEVRFNNAGSDLVTIQPSANGDELTIGAGIAITGNGVGGGTIGNVSAGRTVVNNGTILSNAAGRTITLARFTNNAGATIGGSGGGDLSFTDGWTNSGAITIDGGTLNTGDATTDTWSNPAGAVLSPDGFFTSNGATLELGGTFSAANFLSLGNDGTTTHRIVNAGILDLGQGDLTLPAGETLVIGSGGELSGPGNLISGVGATLALDGSITGNLSNGVTLDASTTLAVPAFTTVNVTGGLTLDGAISLDGNFATLTFVGTQTLGGVGEVRFNNAGSDLVTIQPSANGDELTIGAGIAITGNGVGGGTIGNVSAGRTVVNNGTILSNAAGRTITLARFTNNAGATIGGSGGGDLSFTDGWTNSGAITIDGGTLNTGDATTDTWSNPAGAVLSPDGFFTSNGATLELGGTFSAANFLSLGNDGTTTHRIVNAGILDLGQGDLTLPAGETLVIGSGGELSGPGNLISGVGATLALDGSITGNLSNGVTLDASTTLAVPAFTTVNVTGGLTLDGAISLDGNFATLTFVGTQTLGGVGEVRFNNAGSDLVTIQPSANGDELTIGAGIAITGNGVGGGTIGNVSAGRTVVNNGTILSNAAGRTITLARFTNNAGATIGGSGGGDLSFTDGWTNSGAITIDGGTLNTGDATTDTWSNPAGAVLSPDGFFTSNGATLELGGTFSAANFLSLGNDGTTTHRIVNAGILDLGQGDLTLPAGETLVIGSGGELSGPGNLISGVGATLALDGSITGNLSNGVTLDASTTLAVPAFTTVNVTGGLTLDGAISLDGNFATLTFVGTQTLGGVGEVRFNNAGSDLVTIQPSANGDELTIGAGIAITGNGVGGGTIGNVSAGRTVVNNGTILSNAAGRTITLRQYTNNNMMVAQAGGTLALFDTPDNDGTIRVFNGATVSTGNVNLANNTGGLVEGGGTVDVGSAALVNDGTVAPGIGVNDTAILTITGDYNQATNGLLDIELQGTTPGSGAGFHDQLAVTGTVTLDGDLTVTNINAFLPVAFDSFRIIDGAASLSGDFLGTVTLPASFDPPIIDATFVDLLRNFLATISWDDEAGDGLWTNPVNWDDPSNAVLPGAGDDVAIQTGGTIVLDSGTQSINALFSDQDFTISGGSLTATGSIQLDGLFTLSGGAVDITGAVLDLNGGMTWDGNSSIQGGGSGIVNVLGGTTVNVTGSAGTRNLTALTFNLNPGGTVTHSANGGLWLNTNTQFNNQGTIDLQSDFAILSSGGATIENTGTILKSAGTTSTISIFTNHNGGTITQTSGSIVFSSGGSFDGATTVTGGALSLGGNYTWVDGTTFAGDLTITSGTHDIEGGLTIGTLTFDGGLINIDTLGGGSVGDTFTATNGIFMTTTTASFDTANSGILDLPNGTTLTLGGATGTRNLTALTVNVNPTATIAIGTGAALWLNTNMTLNNQGTIDFQDDVNIISSGGATINNTATIQKTGGTGTSTISIFTNQNNGIIAHTSGSIVFSSGGSFDGATTVTGGALSLGGNYTWVDGTTFAGDLTITSGTHDIEGGLTIGTLTFDGGLINIDTLGGGSVGDTFTATNGIFMTTTTASFDTANSGILDLPNGTTLTLGGATGTRNLTALTVNVNPTATIAIGTGAALWLNTNMTLNNQGTIDFQDDVNIISSGGATINNTATIQKTGGTGTSTISIFTNQNNGIIAHTSGSIVFSSGGSFDGATTVTGGALSLGGNYTWVDGTTFAGDLTITSGTHDIEGGLTIGTLTFDGGLINIDTLGGGSVGDTFTATNGIFMTTTTASFDTANSGILDLPNGTTLTLGGATGTRNLTALTVNVNPTATIAIGTGAALWLNTNMTLNNQGTIDFQDDVNIISSGGATINNTATIQKTGGTGTSTISIFTNQNNGIIAHTSGSIVFSSGGSFDGATTVTGGALSLGGNYTWVDGTTFAGDLTITSGTHDIEGGLTIGTLTFDGGLINIDTLGGGSVGDTFTATNGIFMTTTTASFDTANSGILDLPNGTTLTLGGATGTRNLTALTVNVNPTATIAIGTGAALWLNTNMTLNNQGTIDFQDDVNIISSGGATINNTATIQKTGGTGTSTISIFTNQNNGIIAHTSGSIVFSSGGSFDGATTVTGGALSLGGNYTWVDGTTFAGDLTITSGTHDIEGGLTIGTLTFDGGLINIDTLGGGSVGDTFTATNGIFMTTTTASFDTANSGILDLPNGTTLTLGGATGTRNLTALTVNVNPTATIAIGTGAALWLNTNMTLNNQGTIDFQDDVNIISSGGATINNSGLIVKSAGSGLSAIQILTNHSGGTVDIQTGTLGFLNDLTLGAGDLLTGSGIFSGNVTNDAGTVEPGGVGATGILTIFGSYTQNPAAVLNIEVNNTGTTAGADFDQLVVNTVAGSATLGGTLNVSMLTGSPVGGIRVIDVVNGGTRVGNFAIENIGGAFNAPSYGATFVDLSLAGALTWVGPTTGGFWNNGANWSGGSVPLSSDDVAIGSGIDLTVAAGADASTLSLAAGSSITVAGGILMVNNTTTLAGDLAINGPTASVLLPVGDLDIGGNLNLGEGVLDVSGVITVAGATDWNAAGGVNFAVVGTGDFNADGGFHIAPTVSGSTLTLDRDLFSAFVSTWNPNGVANIVGSGSITNNASIIFNNLGQINVGVSFSNSGLGNLDKNSSGGSLVFVDLSNFGVINLFGDTATVSSAFSNNGTIDVGFGATFDASTVSFTNNSGGVLSGLFGTFAAPADGTGLNNLGTIEPGGVDTVGTLNVSGDFSNASTGNIVIDIQVLGPDPLYDRLNVSGQADLDGTLTLNALAGFPGVADADQLTPLTWLGGSIGSFASLVPMAGEIITDTYNPTDLLLTLNLGAPTFVFDNGAGNLAWNDPLNWSSNLLPSIGDAVSIGAFNVTIAAAATANTLSLAAGGRLTISGGGLTLAGNSTLDGRLVLQGGTLALGGSTLTQNGRFDWSGTSTISNGVLTMPAAARFNITGGAANTLLNVVANIAAPTAYSGGNLVLSSSTFNNSGDFDFQGNRLVNGVGTAVFNSQDGSTLTRSSGTGVAGFLGTTTVTSLGNVAVQSGTLDLRGTTTVNLGANDVLSSGASGTLIANVTNNGGAIRPGGAGAVGQLSIQGNYTNSSGALEVEINGATTNDVLAVTGTTNFGAAAALSVLDVSYLAYVPSVGESHTFITCTIGCSTGGGFGTLNQPGGITHSVAYDSPGGQVRLVVDSVSFAWIGPSGGDWGNGANWSFGSAPDATIDVVLPALNVSINGVATANSLIVDTGGLLTINGGGNLSLAGTLRVRSGATLDNSGTLAVTALTTVNGSYTQNTGANTTLAGLTVGGAFAHNGGSTTVAGTALFTGSLGVSLGTLTLSGASAALNGPFDMTAGTLRFGTGVNSIGGSNNLWQGGTLRSTTGQQTLALQAGATLQLQGAATKTLRDIRLDMSQGDVNLFGSGNLVLTNAVIDNTDGLSFHSYGDGSLAGDATSQFINNGGLFENVSGASQIAVDFVNNATSQVRVLSGSLTLLDTDLADQAAYSTALPGTLGFAAPRTLTGSLANAGTLAAIGPTTTLTLPSGFSNTGNVTLDQATLDLNGQTLTLPAGKLLSGRGTIQNGQVVNNGGVVLVGGPGQLGNLTLDGDYTQNAGSSMVVEVFNNGNTNQTITDTFTVTSAGNTTLNGGALVIGFTSNSAGLVLGDVSPLQLANGATGQFGRVIDAGGNILGFRFSGGVLTILGVTPKTPAALIDDLVGFIQNKEEIREIIESNESLAQIVGDEIARRREQEDEDEEDSSLICTPGA